MHRYIFEFNKKHLLLLTPCIWQSTLVMVCRLESKYEIEWSCPFWQKKNLQQMTRAILGTIIYLHSLNTIHVHFFHDEHFFCFFRIRRQQWSMQFFGKQSPQDMQKNPLTHKYYSPRSFFAIILPLKSLSWKNLI